MSNNNSKGTGSSSSSNRGDSVLVAAVIATSACVVSFVVTRIVQQIQQEKSRKKRMEDHVVQMNAYRTLRAIQSNNSSSKKDKVVRGKLLPNLKIDEVYLWEVESLGNYFPSDAVGIINHMHKVGSGALRDSYSKSLLSSSSSLEERQHRHEERGKQCRYNKLIGTQECILAELVRQPQQGTTPSSSIQRTTAYVRAGPRSSLHFNPKHVNAAIVTCGGLCPGLNNVVREITNSLIRLYGIQGHIYGIRGGFNGFYDTNYPPLHLTEINVENIHHTGGTVLSSSRGGFDLEKIVNFLITKKVSQLYVIGGDGTHRGAFRIHEGCMERGMNVAVAGIPKTIDNDVDYIDRSFGFSSAVEAAQAAIRSAKTEATCNLPNGIGIVKLMGRSAGFIAIHATLGSGDIDLCLVPEVPTVLEGELGCLPHVWRRVKEKGYAVVVVAEGAGEEILGTSAEVDASGNKKLPPIGIFMKDRIEDYFTKKGESATVKFIDPSYMIRSVPANAADSLYCMQLAQNAVHGAMAGLTGFSVGLCNNKMVYLPIPELVSSSPRMMNPHGRTWERVLAQTRQPNTVPPPLKNEQVYESHAPLLR